MLILVILMAVSAAIIFFAMIGYPVLLMLLDKIKHPPKIKKDFEYEPTVSYMIVAHNEEKVIEKKLENALELDYPLDKFQIIVASDFSTDKTNELVNRFIEKHPERTIVLHTSVEHKGKTNAQNEAQRLATGEILVMTDANSTFKKDAIRELVASFTDQDIVYVCGRLIYSNSEDNITSSTESTYWDLDLKMRDIESRLQTITAGNGSIYAVRNSEYIDIPLSGCHDGTMPYMYGIENRKSLFNPDAISYEKAGEVNADEFKRKVRMNRTILDIFERTPKTWKPGLGFFSLFYFGHRTCRYTLWLFHLLFFVCSVIAFGISRNVVVGILVLLQVLAVLMGLYSIHHIISNKYLRLLGYYSMMVLAQVVGAFKQATGKSKPVWEKAETTR